MCVSKLSLTVTGKLQSLGCQLCVCVCVGRLRTPNDETGAEGCVHPRCPFWDPRTRPLTQPLCRFLSEVLKPLVKTEFQLLYVYHLVGPFLQRFQQERTRCMLEVYTHTRTDGRTHASECTQTHSRTHTPACTHARTHILSHTHLNSRAHAHRLSQTYTCEHTHITESVCVCVCV